MGIGYGYYIDIGINENKTDQLTSDDLLCLKEIVARYSAPDQALVITKQGPGIAYPLHEDPNAVYDPENRSAASGQKTTITDTASLQERNESADASPDESETPKENTNESPDNPIRQLIRQIKNIICGAGKTTDM